MILTLKRDTFSENFTLGTLSVNGKQLGFTCEDTDRHLESGGDKVYGETAIPRGEYKVILSFSNRFKKVMPAVLDVPGYEGVRIHGGNTSENTLGCPLLGSLRTSNGVANCKNINERLIGLLHDAEDSGEDVILEVI